MRRSGAAALLLLVLSTTVAMAATLTMFLAAYDGTNVRIEWEVSSETDVTSFDLYRKGVTESSFTLVSNMMPTGQRRYQFLDTNVYRLAAGGGGTGTGTPANAGGAYTYRLTIRNAGGAEQSYTTMLAGTPSAVQRSWGTIKSMFR